MITMAVVGSESHRAQIGSGAPSRRCQSWVIMNGHVEQEAPFGAQHAAHDAAHARRDKDGGEDDASGDDLST